MPLKHPSSNLVSCNIGHNFEYFDLEDCYYKFICMKGKMLVDPNSFGSGTSIEE